MGLSQLPYVIHLLQSPANTYKTQASHHGTPGPPGPGYSLLPQQHPCHLLPGIEYCENTVLNYLYLSPAMLYHHISMPLFILFPLPGMLLSLLLSLLCLFNLILDLAQLPPPWGNFPWLIHSPTQRSFSPISSPMQEVYLRPPGRRSSKEEPMSSQGNRLWTFLWSHKPVKAPYYSVSWGSLSVPVSPGFLWMVVKIIHLQLQDGELVVGSLTEKFSWQVL